MLKKMFKLKMMGSALIKKARSKAKILIPEILIPCGLLQSTSLACSSRMSAVSDDYDFCQFLISGR